MPPPPPPPDLMEELVEAILLRVPADDPASLVRAGLVCKLWRRLVSGAVFRRRFREFHRTAPLLGVLCNRWNYPDDDTTRSVCSTERSVSTYFVPTSSFRPANLDIMGWRAVDARHGRVLLGREPILSGVVGWKIDLAVWDPISDDWQQLPPPPAPSDGQVGSWNAAMLCAAGAAGCDHLDCRGGSFLVVFIGVLHDKRTMISCIYTSESRAWWSKAVTTAMHRYVWFKPGHSHLMGNNTLHFFNYYCMGIVNYDLTTRQVSLNEMHFDPPPRFYCPDEMVFMTMEDGSLGLATTVRKGKLYIWSREEDLEGSSGVARFVQSRVIDLNKLIPDGEHKSCRLKGLADGIGVFFMWTFNGIYSLNILSGEVTKLPDYASYEYRLVPYLSFHTPAQEAVSTGDRTRAGSSSVCRTQVVGPSS